MKGDDQAIRVFGDIILSVYASLLATIPVIIIRKMFEKSRPKDKGFHELEAKLIAKSLLKRQQSGHGNKLFDAGNYDLSNSKSQPRGGILKMSDSMENSERIRFDSQATEVTDVSTISYSTSKKSDAGWSSWFKKKNKNKKQIELAALPQINENTPRKDESEDNDNDEPKQPPHVPRTGMMYESYLFFFIFFFICDIQKCTTVL